jgi:hypothetical protein
MRRKARFRRGGETPANSMAMGKRRSMTTGHNSFSLPCGALLLLAALALAGCETTGTGASPAAQAALAGPPQPPMTHSRAAQECWMSTEKGVGSQDLDKRADYVTKCIDEKMKSADAAPKS